MHSSVIAYKKTTYNSIFTAFIELKDFKRTYYIKFKSKIIITWAYDSTI